MILQGSFFRQAWYRCTYKFSADQASCKLALLFTHKVRSANLARDKGLAVEESRRSHLLKPIRFARRPAQCKPYRFSRTVNEPSKKVDEMRVDVTEFLNLTYILHEKN